RHLALQLLESQGADAAGDRAVVDQRDLRPASLVDVPVDRVVAGVQPAAREPAIERRAGIVEHALPTPVPDQSLGRLGPEALRIVQRPGVDFVVAAAHLVPRASSGIVSLLYRSDRAVDNVARPPIAPGGKARKV